MIVSLQLATSYITKLKEKNFAPKEKGDEALSNSMKKKAPQDRERKRNKGQGRKVEASKQTAQKRWATLRKGKH